jgi:hypothetical protein
MSSGEKNMTSRKRKKNRQKVCASIEFQRIAGTGKNIIFGGSGGRGGGYGFQTDIYPVDL